MRAADEVRSLIYFYHGGTSYVLALHFRAHKQCEAGMLPPRFTEYMRETYKIIIIHLNISISPPSDLHIRTC